MLRAVSLVAIVVLCGHARADERMRPYRARPYDLQLAVEPRTIRGQVGMTLSATAEEMGR